MAGWTKHSAIRLIHKHSRKPNSKQVDSAAAWPIGHCWKGWGTLWPCRCNSTRVRFSSNPWSIGKTPIAILIAGVWRVMNCVSFVDFVLHGLLECVCGAHVRQQLMRVHAHVWHERSRCASSASTRHFIGHGWHFILCVGPTV